VAVSSDYEAYWEILFQTYSANISAEDERRQRAAHKASARGYRAVVEFLLAKSADINTMDTGNRLLDFAARYGLINLTERLLAGGADVDLKDWNGSPPLSTAIYHEYRDMVKLLIDQGADVNITSGMDDTPLHQAAQTNDLDLAKLLLVNGADVNAKGSFDFNRTPLHYVSVRGYKDFVELLIFNGADVNAKDKDGYTPLHGASVGGYEDVVEMLLSNGADVNAKDNHRYGNTPLHRAIKSRHAGVAKLLLASGADVNAKNESGVTPLHDAAFGGDKGLVELLIANGADVNAKDKDGNTPLRNAAYCGHTASVEWLLAKGADVNAKNKRGQTALNDAIAAGFADVVKLLDADIEEKLLANKGPYSVIVTEPQAVRRFLKFYVIDFDDVWIPQKADLEGLEYVLKTSLEKNISIETTGWFDREFLLARIRRYNREYSGFIKDGTKHIVCNMYVLGGYNMYISEAFSRETAGKRFSTIFDGGSAVVRVVFGAASKKVVRIDCN